MTNTDSSLLHLLFQIESRDLQKNNEYEIEKKTKVYTYRTTKTIKVVIT